jgi:hypothetical protein
MSSNVPSNVVAALMTKLELLFGKASDPSGQAGKDAFLSFQLPAIPYSVKELSFRLPASESGLTPQQEKNFAADFARLVNLIPAVSSIWSSDGRTLWNEYSTILSQAIVASDNPTASEAAELQQARELLDSPKYTAYQQYLKAYMTAVENYNGLKLKADNSTDIKVQEDWKLQEPGYKALMKSAYLEWIAKGFKLEVEEAFADIDRIGGRNPQLLWASWKDDFNQSVRTDLEGQNFYETHFFPENFFKPDAQGQWTKLTLDASEIDALSAKAPEGIRNLASSSVSGVKTQAVDLEIARLSVELIRVPIMRSWLNPSVFRSNLWKWSGSREPLSDGLTPPQGSLPAYTTSMILARNFQVELKPNSEKNTQIIKRLQQGELVLLGPLPLQAVAKTVDARSVTKLDASSIALKRADPNVVEQVIAFKPQTNLSSASLDILQNQRIQAVNSLDGRVASFGTLSSTKLSAVNPALFNQISDRISSDQIKKVNPVKINPDLLKKLIIRDPIQSPPIISRPDPPTDEPIPTPPRTSSPNDIQIIAFVCGRLPKSPNPDPNLKW